MNKLQQLLDEKWPISEDATMADKLTLGSFRMIFTEGYNAAMEEKGAKYDTSKVLGECRKMIKSGDSLKALRLYKETMGCSLSDAKAILNI